MMNTDTQAETATDMAVPHFNADWFSQHIPLWEYLLEKHLPRRDKFLEIGSFEGYSACWMLQRALDPCGIIYCIDTWKGSPEFADFPPHVVEQSFDAFQRNTFLSKQTTQQVIALRNEAVDALAGLIHLEHRETFDLVYVDGGHDATDTLRDAVMAWPLLRHDGLMIFDDYTWELQLPLNRRPKMAIDSFTAIYAEELRTISVGSQFVVQKI